MNLLWIKEHRYYKVLLQATLFGTIDVVCVWGRIGGNLGGYKVISCDTDQDVELTINSIKKRRKLRGYK
jgi:predicted DNA-binding WGR domain protein